MLQGRHVEQFPRVDRQQVDYAQDVVLNHQTTDAVVHSQARFTAITKYDPPCDKRAFRDDITSVRQAPA